MFMSNLTQKGCGLINLGVLQQDLLSLTMDHHIGALRRTPLSTMIEIADCHGKVRLHKTDADTMDEFINKLKQLGMVINNFIAHLEDGKCGD